MSDLDGVRKFEYRPSRIAAGIDVEFKTGGETIQGTCKDVSDTGIRVILDGSVLVGSSGVLTLRHVIGVLALEAQVAYMDKSQVGLTFLFKTNWEREITAEYIASIVWPNSNVVKPPGSFTRATSLRATVAVTKSPPAAASRAAMPCE